MRRKPIMLLAAPFTSGSTGRGLAEGFRSLGWAVQEIDSRYQYQTFGTGVPVRFGARLMRPFLLQAYHSAIHTYCADLKPDIFLTVKGTDLSPTLLDAVRTNGTRAVMYYPDLHFDFHNVVSASFNKYDLFITTKTFHIKYLQALLGADRVAYVPHGYDVVHSPIFEHVSEGGYTTDVLYIGSHSSYKQRWLEEALPDLNGATIEIHGNNWLRNASRGPLAHFRMPGQRAGVTYSRNIQLSRINLAIHTGPTASGWEDQVSTRTFEIPACKGFLLHINNDEVKTFFTPGVEIDVFATPGELRDKISYYLARPRLRSQMIARAYERCVPAYSYCSRAKEIALLLTEL